MAKSKSDQIYVCNSCAYESPRWYGQCPNCHEWNTIEVVDSPTISLNKVETRAFKLSKTTEILDSSIERISTGFSEVDRILGGGVVPSEVILVSGEPGVGKSTLFLQLLEKQAEISVYVSAEESIEQVGLRYKRIFKNSGRELQILNCYDVETIIAKLDEIKPKFVVVDSIQTIYSTNARGLPGGVSQIKAVSNLLINYAKSSNIIMYIVGQITKEGDIAGPKLLEHMVDVVLRLEGDDKYDYRVMRCYKNRFGPTTEVGLFEMTEDGMKEVLNPSLYFIRSVDEDRVGVCPGIINEGNRVIIVEVQALSVRSYSPMPKRVTEGVTKSKLELICAIIAKYTKLNIQEHDIYLSIAGGVKSFDPMLDLAIANAIISSLVNKPINKEVVAFGEIALTGQIRFNKQKERLEKELKRLGYSSYHLKFPKVKSISELFPKNK